MWRFSYSSSVHSVIARDGHANARLDRDVELADRFPDRSRGLAETGERFAVQVFDLGADRLTGLPQAVSCVERQLALGFPGIDQRREIGFERGDQRLELRVGLDVRKDLHRRWIALGVGCDLRAARGVALGVQVAVRRIELGRADGIAERRSAATATVHAGTAVDGLLDLAAPFAGAVARR